jgi:hypothetical protein
VEKKRVSEGGERGRGGEKECKEGKRVVWRKRVREGEGGVESEREKKRGREGKGGR